MSQDLTSDLNEAVKGLLYISETESELKPFVWEAGELNDQRVLKLAGAKKGASIEKGTLGSFFRTVSKEDKPKFDKLAKVLKEHLSDVTVYKVGDEPEKQLYVIGKTKEGNWAGVMTTVVET